MTRDVLRRIVTEEGVKPAGKRGGHPVYRLKDVYDAIESQRDPGNMNPYARLALAKAIKTEDEIRVRRRELLERTDVEATYGHLVQIVAQEYETLPDVLERDFGLTAQQAAGAERHCFKARESLYGLWIEVCGDSQSAVQECA